MPLLSTLSTDDYQWFLYFLWSLKGFYNKFFNMILDLNDVENKAFLFGQVPEFQGFLKSFDIHSMWK